MLGGEGGRSNILTFREGQEGAWRHSSFLGVVAYRQVEIVIRDGGSAIRRARGVT
jgi:hypothetical protein